jgi:nucleoside-diphosphate-sugar epimerase
VRSGALPTRPDEPDVIVGDARRMREELGFPPSIGLAQGLSETVAWWRANARATQARRLRSSSC